MKWLKFGKFVITAPGWVKALLGLVLLLALVVMPVVGILVVVLVLVAGLLGVIVRPVRAAVDRFK